MKDLSASTRPSGKSIGRRWRLWLCAVVLGVLAGFAGLPEDSLRYVRAVIREHDVAAKEVVVAIDDRSIAGIGQFPFPRTAFATMLDRAFAAGASRVFFDLNFSTSQSADEDATLAATIRRYPGRVFFGTQFLTDPRTGARHVSLPTPTLATAGPSININIPYDNSGDVAALPYEIAVDGERYQGLAAQIAGVSGKPFQLFPIDTAISIRSIPMLSMIDVMRGQVRPGSLDGKDVIVGPTAEAIKDIYIVQPYGPISSAAIHAIGAETLRGPRPIDIGWWPALLAAVLAGGVALSLRRRMRSIVMLVVTLGGVLTVPMLLPTHIFVSVLPAALMLALMVGVESQRQVRDLLPDLRPPEPRRAPSDRAASDRASRRRAHPQFRRSDRDPAA